MTDHAKRSSLQKMGLAGAMASTGIVGSWVASNKVTALADDKKLAKLTVEVSHGWRGENLKARIRNHSDQAVTMTQMTPSKVSTPMGDLNFDALLAKGDRTLKAKGYIDVNLDKSTAMEGQLSSSGKLLKAMQREIASNLSVVTDKRRFASVTPMFYPNIA